MPGPTGVGVALAVGNDVHRYGLEGMLRSLDDVSSVFSYTTLTDATEAATTNALDVLLTTTGDLDDAMDAATQQHLRTCGVRLLVLVGAADRMQPSWLSRAHGFIDRSSLHLDVLRDAIIDAVGGRFHVTPSLARRLLGPGEFMPPVSLTARELQVLRLVSEGKSNKQAARELGISENGVKRVMGNILAKLHSPNRTLAVVRAFELGLLSGPGSSPRSGEVADSQQTRQLALEDLPARAER